MVWLFTFTVCILFTLTLYQVVGDVMRRMKSTSTPEVMSELFNDSPTRDNGEQTDVSITSLPLFGEVIIQAEEPETEIDVVEHLPETKLTWTLVGTFIESDGSLSSAILDTGSQEQARYYSGERVNDEVRLRNVALGSIVIERDGELERLSLYEERESNYREIARVARRAARKTRATKTARKDTQQTSARRVASRVSANYKTLGQRLAALRQPKK